MNFFFVSLSHLLISNFHFPTAFPLRLISILHFPPFFHLPCSLFCSPLSTSTQSSPLSFHPSLPTNLLFIPFPLYSVLLSTFFLSSTQFSLSNAFGFIFPEWNITVPNTYLHPVRNFLVLFSPKGRRTTNNLFFFTVGYFFHETMMGTYILKLYQFFFFELSGRDNYNRTCSPQFVSKTPKNDPPPWKKNQVYLSLFSPLILFL